jgi:YidC/Oxa1 family membrane protein insertase
MADNRNYILAIVLSILVLVGWQYFVGMPQMERQRQQQAQQQAAQRQAQPGQAAPTTPAAPGAPGAPGTAPVPGAASTAPAAPGGLAPAPAQAMTRQAILASTPRVGIETPRLTGSINLVGARLDDLVMTGYRETISPTSPHVVLFAPAGSPIDPINNQHHFYAEFGYVGAAGTGLAVPTAQTTWTQQGTNRLSPGAPVVLTWDNGQGLTFRRTFEIDANYMVTVKDAVTNAGGQPVSLHA